VRKNRFFDIPILHKGCLAFNLLPFFLFVVLLTLMSTKFVYSEQTNFSITKRDKLLGSYFLDGRNGFLVGARGLLLHTINQGQSWQKVELDTIVDPLNDITFIDKEGWIVGGRGLILHTTNGGQQWIKQSSNSNNSLLALHFINQRKGVVVGEGGTILTTEDGGASWKDCALDWMSILPEEITALGLLAPNLYGVFFIDDVCGWAVGEKGIVLSTSDGGKRWSLVSSGTCTSLYSVYFNDQGEGFMAGENGLLIQSKDGGKIWQQLKLPAEVANLSLFKLVMKVSEGVVVGDRGIVLKSKDGGKTWDKVALEMKPPLPWFLCVSIFPQNSPTQALIAGQGIVIKIIIK
jgi:photosystem II stability/assembly factor-like uncharacterized protein